MQVSQGPALLPSQSFWRLPPHAAGIRAWQLLLLRPCRPSCSRQCAGLPVQKRAPQGQVRCCSCMLRGQPSQGVVCNQGIASKSYQCLTVVILTLHAGGRLTAAFSPDCETPNFDRHLCRAGASPAASFEVLEAWHLTPAEHGALVQDVLIPVARLHASAELACSGGASHMRRKM